MVYLQRWYGWCHMKLQPYRRKSWYTIQPCTISFHAKPAKVYACLDVTCHLHFWQNDRDLLRVTAVTRGWNEYRNKSQHRKSTLEKKTSPAAPAGIRTRDLSSTELSPPATWSHFICAACVFFYFTIAWSKIHT